MTRRWHMIDLVAGALSFVAFCLIYAPLIVVAVFSVWQPVRVRGVLGLSAPNLDSYVSLATNHEILSAVYVTLGLGAASTVIGLILGTVFAFFYFHTTGLPRQIMQALIFLPFLLPPIITGLALLVAFREMDLTRGFKTILVGHVVVVVPITYRTVLVRLRALNPGLREASLDLGASNWQTLRHILLPQLGTALLAAALLAFAVSFDETMVTLFLSGSNSTLPIRLWSMMRLGFVPDINALATVIVVLAICTAICAGLLHRYGFGREKN